jgi:FAD/FMN-containing dehydrogenase
MPGGNIGGGVVVDLVCGFRAPPRVDPEARLAYVRPGITLAELNTACAPHSLQFPVAPSSGDRCTIGGMIANNAAGARSVRYGATRAWVESLDLVLADGSRATTMRGQPVSSGAPGAPDEGAPGIERGPRVRAPSHTRRRAGAADSRTIDSLALARTLAMVDSALLPDRARIEETWPRVRKNSSGYAIREYLETGDAVDLLVGSEGTLAMIVGAILRLAPVPARRGVALLEFSSLEAAGEAVLSLLPLGPSTCELLDRTFLALARSGGESFAYPIGHDREAILLVEMEGDSTAEVSGRLDEIRSAVINLADDVSIAIDPDRQAAFWGIRHAASPTIARLAGDRVSMQFIEDGVVPIDRLADYIHLLRSTLARHDLPAVIFGHAGDGNLHVNPLVDVTAPGWRGTLEDVLTEIAAGVAELGGTLAGEHGDGRLRAPFLDTIWGSAMVGRFRAVKDAFDPSNILNPGVILPLPGQRAFDLLS